MLDNAPAPRGGEEVRLAYIMQLAESTQRRLRRAEWIPRLRGQGAARGTRSGAWRLIPALRAEYLADGAGEAGEDVVAVDGGALVERYHRMAVAMDIDEALLRADYPDEASAVAQPH